MGPRPPSLSQLVDDDDRRELRALLEQLGADETATEHRVVMCDAVATGLARIGQVLWVHGWMFGPHRVSGESRHGFGDDRVVGVATLAQIGGELARGAVELLRAGNRYAAAALIRQLFEVEYLTHAFAGDHESAAAWLRANGKERREFWSPQKLRDRADGAFIDEHFWSHCERGGHPTLEGVALLPDHTRQIDASLLWVDLAGHLARIWRHVLTAAELACGRADTRAGMEASRCRHGA